MIHKLKIETQYFKQVISGEKTFEIRFNDRNYTAGDSLLLCEYDPETGRFSGNSVFVSVTSICDDIRFVKPGYVVMSIKVLPKAVVAV